MRLVGKDEGERPHTPQVTLDHTQHTYGAVSLHQAICLKVQ